MSVQLFVKAPGDLTYRRLDLFPTEPIKLTLSVANIQDPLAANSVFSRTFKVPHTGQNGPFFKAAFNVNSTDFDASKKADAYINDNGVFFAIGNIRLLSIFVNEAENNVEYEINFYGETSDFGSKIGGGFLNEVNLSAYNHSLSYNNVVNSWSNNLLGGQVIYPLIEWGYNYTTAGQPQPSFGTMSVGGVKSFTGPTANKALNFPQLKPLLKAKALWDAIFAETGYTYNSTFIETDPLFTNLYVVAENEAKALVSADLSFEATDGGVSNEVGANGPTSNYPTITDALFPFEIADPSNSYNPTLSHYTAESPGTYTFEISGYIELIAANPAATGGVLFSIVDVNTGTVLSTTSPLVVTVPAPFTKSLSASLVVGQTVKLRMESIALSGNNADYITIFGCTFKTTSVPSTVVMSSFMPSNIRKIDFMRSIINRFRLVFVPSKDDEKHFEITPWKDWVLQGTQRDWTTKLDGSKDMKIVPLFYGQERLQVYKDQEDADFVNYNYQLDYKQTYGQLNKDSNNELIKGSKTVQDQFAPTPLYPIGGVEPSDPGYAFLIPHMAKDTDTQRQPIQPKLRLVYYNGLVPAPVTWYMNQIWNPISGVGSNPTAFNSYPLVSQFSNWPVTGVTFDLNWENEAPLYDTEVSGLSQNITSYDCFNVFWKTWYDTTFDPFSRIVEANFVLSYQDILEIKFNDYVFVKDAWYFVNKITDYVIGSETNCRVELVKVGGNIGLVIPPNTIVYKQKELCYGTTPCEAYCCTYQVGQFYTDNVLFANSTVIYGDALGSIPAPDGYYSDGTTTVQTFNGVIVQFLSPICNCNPPDLYPYTVCVGTTSCEAYCCEGASITVWGTSSVDLASSGNVYLDSAGTIPANGWYAQTGSPYTVRVITGVTWAIGLGSACNCDTIVVYEHNVVFKSTETALCEVCCDNTEQTIYTDAELFSDSTEVYIDNVPLTKGGEGYWRKAGSNDVLVTDVNGDVIEIASCVGCDCDYHYIGENCVETTLLARFTSPTPLNIGDVIDSVSYSNQCWVIIQEGTTPGEPVTTVYETCEECAGPPAPCECYEYEVDGIAGGAISYIDCDTQEVAYMDIAPATSYLICACRGSVIPIFGKLNIVERGECGGVVYNPISATYFGNEVSGCTVCCDTTGTAVTVYGDGLTLALSTVIYGDSEGTTSVLPGYYKDLSGNTYYVDTLGNISFFNCGGCPPCDSIYVGGSFDVYDGVYNKGVALINVNTADLVDSFNGGIGFNRTDGQFTTTLVADVLDHDGCLYVVGNFNSYKGVPANGIIKLNYDGSINDTFHSTTGFASAVEGFPGVNQVVSYGPNKILVRGTFTSYNGTSASRIICLNNDGSINEEFVVSPTAVSGTNFRIIGVVDEKIYVYNLTTWKGVSTSNPISVLNNLGVREFIYPNFDEYSIPVIDSVARIYSIVRTTTPTTTFKIRRFFTDGTMDPDYEVLVANGAGNTLYIDESDNLYYKVNTTATGSVNGTTFTNIAKLDAFGTLIPEFNVTTGFSPVGSKGNMKVVGDTMYVYGNYVEGQTYNGVEIGAIVKISAVNAELNTTFAKKVVTGAGGGGGIVNDLTIN